MVELQNEMKAINEKYIEMQKNVDPTNPQSIADISKFGKEAQLKM